jgi:hypothetical protein
VRAAGVLVCVGAASLAVDPAAAFAATVTLKDRYGADVIYVAALGERNDVVVTERANGAAIEIADPGAVVTASGLCEASDPHTAVCRADKDGLLYQANVKLGDLDDRISSTGVNLIADGGSGDDLLMGAPDPTDRSKLTGGDGDDQLSGNGRQRGGAGNDQLNGGNEGNNLDGGPGNDLLNGGDAGDRLDGGGGLDALHGGGGPDRLTDGDRDAVASAPADADTLDGGPGSDTLSYEERTRPVSVRMGGDLNAGAAGEHDRALSFEHAIGGAAGDRLIGNRQANWLTGLGGDDRLDSGAGKDDLSGGQGRDRLFGRGGDDRIDGGAGVDVLSCGGGHDVLDVVGRRSELLPRGCESLVFAYSNRLLWVRPRPHRTRDGGLALRMDCPFVGGEFYDDCRGEVVIRETRGRRRLLARGSFSIVFTDTFSVPLSVTSVGSRWVAGRLGRGSATVVLHYRDGLRAFGRLIWRIRP